MSAVEGKEKANKLSFTSPNFDPEAYRKVSVSANLVELFLVKQNFEAHPAKFWVAESDGGRFKQSYSGAPCGNSLDAEGGVMIGGYEWKAEIKLGRKKILKLHAEYVLIYDGLNECDKEYTDLYFNKVGRFTTYPYFRSLFSISAGNANLSLDPLPSLVDRVD